MEELNRTEDEGKVNQKNLIDYITDYEGGEITEEDMLDLFQYLVDTGMAWTLQGHYGRTATDLIEAGLIHESVAKGGDKMLTEKKKTPIMIQRLKKWKKWKGVSKEDIQKYGTPEEIKLLEDFEDEHGIPSEDEIPLGDEQDQSDIPEERPIEDEQEAGTEVEMISREELTSALEEVFANWADADVADAQVALAEVANIFGIHLVGEEEEL